PSGSQRPPPAAPLAVATDMGTKGTHQRRLCLFTELKGGEGDDQALGVHNMRLKSANGCGQLRGLRVPRAGTRLRTMSRFGQGRRLEHASPPRGCSALAPAFQDFLESMPRGSPWNGSQILFLAIF